MSERNFCKTGIPEVGADQGCLIEKTKIFALDMDGTIYLGEKWIDGAREFLACIAETGREYFFLTNNSSKSPQAYADKLRGMGFETTLDHIITSGQATIWYLKKHFPGKRVFLLGNDLLRAEFEEAGIEVTQSGSLKSAQEQTAACVVNGADYNEAELVVTGFDTTLDYVKMCQVCDLVRKGLPYIATHPDYNCPTETGFIPDIGAIAAFIKASTGREPDTVVGKPYAPIAEYLMERARKRVGGAASIGFSEIAMVGDRLYTDVACGVNAGMTGILVLSGEASLFDVEESDVKPDLIFRSVKDIVL